MPSKKNLINNEDKDLLNNFINKIQKTLRIINFFFKTFNLPANLIFSHILLNPNLFT